MKRARWMGMMVMAAATVLAVAGYTLAGNALPMEAVAAAMTEVPAAETPAPEAVEAAPLAQQTERAGLRLTVQTEYQKRGARVTVYDAGGKTILKFAVTSHGDGLAILPPDEGYRVETMDGLSATFTLEENASVSNVQGSGWTDGEILYVTAEPKCTLTVLHDVSAMAPETAVQYTLTAAGLERIVAVGPQEDGAPVGKAVFTGLVPGQYTLIAPDGREKAVEITAEQPAMSMSFE